MASDAPRQYVPLTCHGHSRPVPHLSFSPLENDDVYYMISACKGMGLICPARVQEATTNTETDGNPMLRDGQTGDWYGPPFPPNSILLALNIELTDGITGSEHFSAIREQCGRRS